MDRAKHLSVSSSVQLEGKYLYLRLCLFKAYLFLSSCTFLKRFGFIILQLRKTILSHCCILLHRVAVLPWILLWLIPQTAGSWVVPQRKDFTQPVKKQNITDFVTCNQKQQVILTLSTGRLDNLQEMLILLGGVFALFFLFIYFVPSCCFCSIPFLCFISLPDTVFRDFHLIAINVPSLPVSSSSWGVLLSLALS